MKKILILINLIFGGSVAFAQNQYLVTFQDKGPEAAFFRQHPEKVLGEKALARRQKHRVGLQEEDLPVSQTYLRQLGNKKVQVLQKSKWLNAALIETDLSVAALFREFPAIETVKRLVLSTSRATNKLAEVKAESSNANRLSYGATVDQIDQLNLDCLHDKGFQGKGVLVAVFDTGFPGVNTVAAYDSLRQQNRILATRNFVNKANTVFGTHDHGAAVLSTIAANRPGIFVGGAARATFALAITENIGSETHQEELNWAAAAEWADSLGADIIHSSLGYKNFDQGQGDYTNAMIDGDTPIITRAADKAAKKGILVIVSAGNDGQFPATGNPSSRVNPPCDGDSVLCVGSVNIQDQYSSFSSVGPTADNRIKPDVVALGSGTAFVNPAGAVGFTNGTSLAAPLITSVAACIMEASPNATNMQVYQAIIRSANRFSNPNNQYGYGLPDACKADSLLGVLSGFPEVENQNTIKIYPTFFQDKITVEVPVTFEISAAELYTVTGQQVSSLKITGSGPQVLQVESSLPAGLYLLQVRLKNGRLLQFKTVKH